MAIFMEQVAESGSWADITERPDVFPGKRVSRGLDSSTRARRLALLSRVVETEILPRLAQSRRTGQAAFTGNSCAAAAAQVTTTEDDTTTLVRLLLSREATGAVEFIERLEQRGVRPADLYLGIMTDAARRLGELWDDDRCDLTQLTISMGRLQLLVRALSPRFQRGAIMRPQAETVLLLPAPGDQHMFGLMVLAEFFIREGWHVKGGPGFSANDAVAIASRSWIDVVSFSIGSRGQMEALATGIRAIRRASCNPGLHVMVGGPLFAAQPGLVARVGADIAASDAQAAVWQARRLLTPRAATG